MDEFQCIIKFLFLSRFLSNRGNILTPWPYIAFHYGRVATAPSPPPLKRSFAAGRTDEEDKISKDWRVMAVRLPSIYLQNFHKWWFQYYLKVGSISASTSEAEQKSGIDKKHSLLKMAERKRKKKNVSYSFVFLIPVFRKQDLNNIKLILSDVY